MKSSKKTVRIAFVDFWPGFDAGNNMYVPLIYERYDVVEDYINPEVVVHSVFGNEHLLYPNAVRICICGENCYPDLNVSDFAISSMRCSSDLRHLYVPVGMRYDDSDWKIPPVQSSDVNRRFCSFIYSQDTVGKGAVLRREFCKLLMTKYKTVDCPGKVLHNMDAKELCARHGYDWHRSKLVFMNRYKFNIAFENSEGDGYITEKLIDCYKANVVPIYWGSFGNVSPFPEDSMILANRYKSFEDLIARIEEIDEDSEKYLQILRANPLRNTRAYDYKKEIAEFLTMAIDSRGELFDKWDYPCVLNNKASISIFKPAELLSERELSEVCRIRTQYRAISAFLRYLKKIAEYGGLMCLYFVRPLLEFTRNGMKKIRNSCK